MTKSDFHSSQSPQSAHYQWLYTYSHSTTDFSSVFFSNWTNEAHWTCERELVIDEHWAWLRLCFWPGYFYAIWGNYHFHPELGGKCCGTCTRSSCLWPALDIWYHRQWPGHNLDFGLRVFYCFVSSYEYAWLSDWLEIDVILSWTIVLRWRVHVA